MITIGANCGIIGLSVAAETTKNVLSSLANPTMRAGVTTTRHLQPYHFALNLQFELEDAFRRVTGAKLIEVPPPPSPNLGRRMLRRLGKTTTSEIESIEQGLDVLFVPCLAPLWVHLDHIRHWRQNCGKVIYYLFDAWPNDQWSAPLRGTFVEQVDLVAISFGEAVDHYRRLLPTRVEYVPQAADPSRFFRVDSPRVIFCNAPGRQDESFLAATRDYCRERDHLVVYSSHHGRYRRSWEDMQNLYADLLRRSKYCLSWSASERADWGQRITIDPTTARWFQAAAAGALLVGTPPASPQWSNLFPEGSVLDVRDFGHDAQRVFEHLESLPDYEIEARTTQLAQHVTSHHTWDHRVREMLSMVGLRTITGVTADVSP